MFEAEHFNTLPRSILSEIEEEALAQFKELGAVAFTVGTTGGWKLTRGGKPLFYCGVKKGTALTNRVELWFMLCKEFRNGLRTNLVMTALLLNKLLEIFPNIEARTFNNSKFGAKFAESMGFHKIRQDDEYTYYRKN